MKGILLVRSEDFRKKDNVPIYPTTDIGAWVQQFRQDRESVDTVEITKFGTLGDLTRGNASPLIKLCSSVGASPQEKDWLFAAYEFLRTSIRNRDAHAYVPNVRDSHFNLVPELFSNCFNILVSWLPDGPTTLNHWRSESRKFVASL